MECEACLEQITWAHGMFVLLQDPPKDDIYSRDTVILICTILI